MRRLKFTLEFDMENAAFAPSYTRDEVARILLDIHNRVLHDQRTEGIIHDVNGNNVGQWSMDQEED